jgi:hypothetical protein
MDHDGKQIAFASDRHGNLDIFVVAADGGEQSASFHSASETPYSFSADGKASSSARRAARPAIDSTDGLAAGLYQVHHGWSSDSAALTPAERCGRARIASS